MKKNIKILIVDDHEINLEILEVYLSQLEGIKKIIRAGTGEEALQVFHEEQVDLVLLDVMLPDASGYDLCQYMKNHDPDQFIPIIMITALGDKESMLQGLAAGADDFLTKPVNGAELKIRVKNLLKLRDVTAKLNERYREISSDLMLAKELLYSFLPQALPSYPNLEIELIYQPSHIIGGDFYDFFPINDHTLGVFIADVKGHGVSSAMVMANLKEKIHQLKAYWNDADGFLQKINGALYHFFHQTINDYYISAVYCILDLAKNQIRYVNAGHVTPYLLQNQQAIPLHNDLGFPLGLFEDNIFDEKVQDFYPGDALYLYTDGLFEIPDFLTDDGIPAIDLSAYLNNRLGHLQKPDEIKQALSSFLLNYIHENTLTDDLNVIIISRMEDGHGKRSDD